MVHTDMKVTIIVEPADAGCEFSTVLTAFIPAWTTKERISFFRLISSQLLIFFKTEYSVNVNYDSDENKNKQESNIEHESVNMKIEKVSKNTRLMQNNWNTKMIQGLYPFHEISADILRDSWKKSATACQYRSRCPLDEGFNSDRLYTTDEEALLGKMNNNRAIFWCMLLGLNNALGEYIFMDL